MQGIEPFEKGWRIRAGGVVLDLDRGTGCLSRLVIAGRRDALGARKSATALGVTAGAAAAADKDFVWTERPGQVTVRDDRLGRVFTPRDAARVRYDCAQGVLTVRKTFRGAPWALTERYAIDGDAIHWQAEVTLDAGDFRSCCVSYLIPWPQPLYSMQFWAAKDGMPSAPHRFTGLKLEYGEITSGMLLPAFSSYRADKNAGLLVTMPFDFRTPHFTVASGYRDLDLDASFDWLALAPGKPARTSLLLCATAGDWRPALGWLYSRFQDYFEPRSTLIHNLWGGHVSGECDVTRKQARDMVRLGLRWHEIHRHFPAYGNYHPERRAQWKTGHHPHQFKKWITVDMVRRTIRNLHAEGAAALPYIQVSGDGAAKGLAPALVGSRVRGRDGECIYSKYYDTYQLNADPALPFGQDVARQIEGMVKRYPEMDGVFLDQACYNWIDTAHDDGISAIDNRPVYMTGFNYYPHLERLCALLHPAKAIIGNGPYGVGIMKYLDGFMAEGDGWLCDLQQYYGIGRKPLFFLMYEKDDAHIEMMFQKALLFGAGFSSYPQAMPSKDLYDAYVPVIERLYRRRWVFDPAPLQLPPCFQGQIYRGETGSLLVSLVRNMPRLAGRRIPDASVRVNTADIGGVKQAVLHQPGRAAKTLALGREAHGLQFAPPPGLVAGVVELVL